MADDAAYSKTYDLLLRFMAFQNGKKYRQAAGKVSSLSFFRDGMLGPLERIARGEGGKLEQRELKKLLTDSEGDVAEIMSQLRETRNKLSGTAEGSEFARNLDQILWGPMGKGEARYQIAELIKSDVSSREAAQWAKTIVNTIEAFNADVASLARKALEY